METVERTSKNKRANRRNSNKENAEQPPEIQTEDIGDFIENMDNLITKVRRDVAFERTISHVVETYDSLVAKDRTLKEVIAKLRDDGEFKKKLVRKFFEWYKEQLAEENERLANQGNLEQR